ncbi:MAG TPA: BON domain-containing protein [Kofleriaceae bacterium]|nr:BON domain-containing protein [Kofleriaceae bacterium]
MANHGNGRHVIDDDDDDRHTSRDDRYARGREEGRYVTRDEPRNVPPSQRYGHWEDRTTRTERDEGYRKLQSRELAYPGGFEQRARERDDDDEPDDTRGGYLGQGGQQLGYVESRHGHHQEGGMYGHGPGTWGERRTSHRGKGPANYTRSDERIRELVCEALTDDHDVDATRIEVTVTDGEVSLAGTVEDRYQKRMAENCAECVSGVKDVHNQLRIAVDKQRPDRA